LTIILLCRFFLEIRQRSKHPNGTSDTPFTIRSFQAATQYVHNAIVGEFGDLSFDESFGEGRSEEDVERQEKPSQHADPVVDPAEPEVAAPEA
jgi:hypothetical protein